MTRDEKVMLMWMLGGRVDLPRRRRIRAFNRLQRGGLVVLGRIASYADGRGSNTARLTDAGGAAAARAMAREPDHVWDFRRNRKQGMTVRDVYGAYREVRC